MKQPEIISDTICEANVVGALLTGYGSMSDVDEYLQPDSFTTPAFREIYSAISSLYQAGEEITFLSAWSELSKRGTILSENELLNYAVEPMGGDSLESMALRLKELAARRALCHLGNIIIAQSNSGEAVDIAEIYDNITKFLNENNEKTQVQTLGTALERLTKRIEENKERKTILGTPTGFKKLDAIGGLHGGDLVVVAGSTSQGKTSFALSIALTAIEKNCKVAYYSLEMDMVELSARLVAMRSGVKAATIMYHKPTLYDMLKIDRAKANLPIDNLFFDDRASTKLETILSSIRSLKIKQNIDGAVIDYLQILNINTKTRESQEQLMAYAARRMKNLAKELGIWIMALSQLNRGSNIKESEEPSLSRLRNSGQIAEAADIVLLVYRPEVFGVQYKGEFEGHPTHNTAQVHLAKGRNIGTFRFLCEFVPETTLFKDANIPQNEVRHEKEEETIEEDVMPF